MPIHSTHPDYDDNLWAWERCRTVIAGAEAVKAAGQKYLPMLGGQEPQEYEHYKLRAMFYAASGRTVTGLVGALMRKDPIITAPDAIVEYLQDATLTGDTIFTLIQWIAMEIFITGRVGVHVDFIQHEAGLRPFLSGYSAESIRNWTVEQVNHVPTLTRIVLEERGTIDTSDPYEPRTTRQLRSLYLSPEGNLTVEIWQRNASSQWAIVSQNTPSIKDQPIPFVPFCFIGTSSINATPEKPPLLDLVDLNLSHYRNSADLEHGLHFTALPTPWMVGFPRDTEPKIGPSNIWISQNADAKVGMLEFTGSGLDAIGKNMKDKEVRMAVIGSRILEEKTPAVEAHDTIQERHSSERSILSSISTTISHGVTRALKWYTEFAGLKGDTTLELNRDFVSAKMGGQELVAMMTAWQQGGMSWDTLYYNMQRGEVTRPGITAEEERDLIEQEQMKMKAELEASIELPHQDDDAGEDQDEDQDEEGDGRPPLDDE